MMVQTQILAFDDATRARLKEISRAIELQKDNRAAVVKLLAEHDEIVKRAKAKPYDPREEAKWA